MAAPTLERRRRRPTLAGQILRTTGTGRAAMAVRLLTGRHGDATCAVMLFASRP